jgi:hypothetical protein
MKNSFIKIWALCYVFFGISLPASAAVLTFVGDFDATFDNGTQGIPNLTGNWSFDFDTDRITNIGFEKLTVDLTSLTLSPSLIGTTTFDISNTSGWLSYESGILTRLVIGGDIGGSGGSSDIDDFSVLYDGAGNTIDAVISVASINSIDIAPGPLGGSLSGGFSVVPIPPAVWLFSSGILGLIAMAKRSKAA